MHKEDYELIAEQIKLTAESMTDKAAATRVKDYELDCSWIDYQTVYAQALHSLIQGLLVKLEINYDNFDREKFLRAAGINNE